MIKIIGSFLITISGTLCGKFIFDQFIKRISFLEDFAKFVHYAKNEIKYKVAYPQVILNQFKCNSDLNLYFKRCKNLIENGENFPGAWEKTFNLCSYDEKNIILNFGRNLGSYSSDEQILLCDRAEEEIKERLLKLNKEIDKNKKICLTIGTCVGIIVSILLF